MQASSVLVDFVDGELNSLRIAYYFYFIVFVILCMSAIILPIVATIMPESVKVKDVPAVKILTAITAVVAGVIGWARLDIVCDNFNQARNNLQLALLQYRMSPNSDSEVALRDTLFHSESLIRAFSPGIPEQTHNAKQDDHK